jgi:aromatic ring-cleaving dioxygenase
VPWLMLSHQGFNLLVHPLNDESCCNGEYITFRGVVRADRDTRY